MARNRSDCKPRVLGVYDVDDVIASYIRLYREGRHRAPPPTSMFSWMTERGRGWVLASLPLALLNYQTSSDSGEPRIDLARAYATMPAGDFPPGTASYNAHSQRKRVGKAFVHDGNHRSLAAEFRGDCSIRMFMLGAEYDALVADAKFRGLS
jgi:hypothetical protein